MLYFAYMGCGMYNSVYICMFLDGNMHKEILFAKFPWGLRNKQKKKKTEEKTFLKIFMSTVKWLIYKTIHFTQIKILTVI